MARSRIVHPVSIDEVERIAFALAQKLGFDEPIPPFTSRYPNILESCVETPFQRFYKITPYPSLYAKASILFYLLIKNHPFKNGNKRIALTTMLVFLHKHGKWLNTAVGELFEFTKWVAESNPKDKNFVLLTIEAYIKKHSNIGRGTMDNEKLKAVRAHLASQSPLEIPPAIWRHRETGLYWATYEVQGTGKILACGFNEDSDISLLRVSGSNEKYIKENRDMLEYVPVDDTP